MALTPLHSLRLGVGGCNVVGRRSFRGTWEPTPPDPTGLEVGAVGRGTDPPLGDPFSPHRPQRCHVIGM